VPPTSPPNPPASVPHPLIAEWATRLRAVARRTLGTEPITDPDATPDARRAFLNAFADEQGNRARVATPFLAAVMGLPLDALATPRPGAMDLDDRLWWALHDPHQPITDLTRGVGPLDPGLAEIAIESRTETELSAMHALYRLGLDRAQPALIARAFDAARWHAAELQPDNGTNHPWSVHVFVLLAAHSQDPGESGAALMHAQTLLHNCQVQQGRADRLSACILWDAAMTLDRAP
jgi:hypothetical protein